MKELTVPIFNLRSTVTGLKDSLPADRYVRELMKLWDKQKVLEDKFEVEKDSHFKAQEAQEDHIVPIKSEPMKKKIKAEIVPTVKRDLFYGTPLSFTNTAACSSSSSSSSHCSSDHPSSDS